MLSVSSCLLHRAALVCSERDLGHCTRLLVSRMTTALLVSAITPMLHLTSSSGAVQRCTAKVSGFVAVHLCWNAPELCQVPKFIGVIALTSKAVVILLHRAALVQ